jgi:hypothetical protein
VFARAPGRVTILSGEMLWISGNCIQVSVLSGDCHHIVIFHILLYQ